MLQMQGLRFSDAFYMSVRPFKQLLHHDYLPHDVATHKNNAPFTYKFLPLFQEIPKIGLAMFGSNM